MKKKGIEKEKVEFIKESISSATKVSRLLMQDSTVNIGRVGDDLTHDLFTVQLEAQMLSHLSETRELIYHCEPPTFLDWLFKKRKEAKFTLKVKDVLLDPPLLHERTKRFYVTKEN